MIISHKHKFIFLHIPKTAGSSMAVYLSRFLGDDDIMMDAWNDALHHGIPYNKRVYKEALSQRGKLYLEEALRKRMEDGKIFDRPVVDYAFRKKIAEHLGTDSMHATAGHLSRYVPEEWNSYFKFAFMRNPYSQAVSLYNWRAMQVSGRDHLIGKEWGNQSEPVIPFREFLLRILDVTRPDPEGFVSVDNRFKYSGWNIVSIDNKIEVDFIGRFESLREDFGLACDRIGIKHNPSLMPYSKKNSKQLFYKNYFDTETKDLVSKIWKKEIDFFGYSL